MGTKKDAANGLVTVRLRISGVSGEFTKNVLAKNSIANGAQNKSTITRYVVIKLVAVFLKNTELNKATHPVVKQVMPTMST